MKTMTERTKVFVGEQAVNEGAHLGKLYGALGEAAFLIGLEKNQDVVALASYAPLFEHVHYHSWVTEPDPVPKCRELWNTDLLCMENVWKKQRIICSGVRGGIR